MYQAAQGTQVTALVGQIDSICYQITQSFDEFVNQHGYHVLSRKPLRAEAATDLVVMFDNLQVLRELVDALKKACCRPSGEQEKTLHRLNC